MRFWWVVVLDLVDCTKILNGHMSYDHRVQSWNVHHGLLMDHAHDAHFWKCTSWTPSGSCPRCTFSRKVKHTRDKNLLPQPWISTPRHPPRFQHDSNDECAAFPVFGSVWFSRVAVLYTKILCEWFSFTPFCCANNTTYERPKSASTALNSECKAPNSRPTRF